MKLDHLIRKYALRVEFIHDATDGRTTVVVLDGKGIVGIWGFTQAHIKNDDDALGAWLGELRRALASRNPTPPAS